VGWKQLTTLFLATHERGMSGSIVECGVARGGSAALMALNEARTGSNRKIWLFDSYEGLPEPSVEDLQGNETGKHIRPLPKGSCLGTIEQVSELLFDTLRLDRNNIKLVKGWFENTLPVNRTSVGTISVLRIDADWYDSVKCCLDQLYDQVEPGGYVIIDDYGSCFGAQKAVDEFLAARQLSVELVADGRGGCDFVKPG
jgi:predicted O-methyltransferase YrrM